MTLLPFWVQLSQFDVVDAELMRPERGNAPVLLASLLNVEVSTHVPSSGGEMEE